MAKKIRKIMFDAPEIEKVLVMSTRHVSLETSEWLGRRPVVHELMVDVLVGGWLVWVGNTNSLRSYRHDNIPDDLWACMCAAISHDCDYVKFNHDGPIYDELPTFDWYLKKGG